MTYQADWVAQPHLSPPGRQLAGEQVDELPVAAGQQRSPAPTPGSSNTPRADATRGSSPDSSDGAASTAQPSAHRSRSSSATAWAATTS
jgi:hypothetical protein